MCSARSPKADRSIATRLLSRSAVLLLVSFLFSCAHVPSNEAKPFPFQELEKAAEGRDALSGTVHLTHSAKGKTVTVPGVLLVEWPDRLRLELQDPVGSLLALLIVNGDRFWLYQSNRKENLTGPLARLPSGISFPFLASDWVRVFLARPDLSPFRSVTARGVKAEVETKEGSQSLEWSADRFQIETWMKKIPGLPVCVARYEDYTSRSGRLYPTKLRLISAPGEAEERSALVEWNEWEPQVFDKKVFQIPPARDFGRKTKALP